MPHEHGPRLAELLPQGRLVEIEDSRTLIPEDQPAVLAARFIELLCGPELAALRRDGGFEPLDS